MGLVSAALQVRYSANDHAVRRRQMIGLASNDASWRHEELVDGFGNT